MTRLVQCPLSRFLYFKRRRSADLSSVTIDKRDGRSLSPVIVFTSDPSPPLFLFGVGKSFPNRLSSRKRLVEGHLVKC